MTEVNYELADGDEQVALMNEQCKGTLHTPIYSIEWFQHEISIMKYCVYFC